MTANLKKYFAVAYPILTVGRAWAILEGEDAPTETPKAEPPAAE
ncbi:MAG: hypothetical protein PHC52_11915 [Syntrophales bacterium]|nr:hypothetical protein [Syntrophales bacterium]